MPATPARRRRERARFTPFQKVLLGLIITLSTALLAFGAFVLWEWYRFNQIERLDLDEALAEVLSEDDPINFLLVGSDRRDSVSRSDPDAAYLLGEGAPGGQRADTIMVLRLDPAGEGLDLLSVPRDLWVDLPAGGQGRINAAYVDGADQLINAVNDTLDIPIHHYVEIEFGAFRDLVDLVGGVHLWFDTTMRDPGSGLYVGQTGCVLLDGIDALAFARSRKPLFSNGVRWVAEGTGDLGRITRQQIFMRRVADDIADINLSDPRRIDDLLDIAVDNVSFDDNLGINDFRALAARFGDVGGDAIGLWTLPTEGFATSGGASVLRLLEEQAQPVLNLFGAGAPASEDGVTAVVSLEQAAANLIIDILNGTGVAGQATSLAEGYESLGFKPGRLGDAEIDPAATTIVHHPDDAAAADLIARHLVNGALITANPNQAIGTVVITTGPDFSGTQRSPHKVNPAQPATTTTTTEAPPEPTLPTPTTSVSGRAIGEVPPGESCP